MRPQKRGAEVQPVNLLTKNSFDIEDIIDVNHLDLRATLSDKPVAKPKALSDRKSGILCGFL